MPVGDKKDRAKKGEEAGGGGRCNAHVVCFVPTIIQGRVIDVLPDMDYKLLLTETLCNETK